MSSINPIAQGKYVTANRYKDMIYTSGMTPRDNGVLILSGRVKGEGVFEEYREAVRLATANAYKAAVNILAEGERIEKVVTLTVYINAEEGFKSHAKIADFASDFLREQLGENGIGSRAAVGMYSLPGDSPVEVQLVLGVVK